MYSFTVIISSTNKYRKHKRIVKELTALCITATIVLFVVRLSDINGFIFVHIKYVFHFIFNKQTAESLTNK